MQFSKILLLPKVLSLPLGFRYLVFGIPFECDQVSNFLKILGLHDKLFKKQLRTLVRPNTKFSASRFLGKNRQKMISKKSRQK